MVLSCYIFKRKPPIKSIFISIYMKFKSLGPHILCAKQPIYWTFLFSQLFKWWLSMLLLTGALCWKSLWLFWANYYSRRFWHPWSVLRHARVEVSSEKSLTFVVRMWNKIICIKFYPKFQRIQKICEYMFNIFILQLLSTLN